MNQNNHWGAAGPCLRMLSLGLAFGMAALAGPVTHTLNFTRSDGSPISGVSGGFTYDEATQVFSGFQVDWHGLSFDLTSAASAPNLDGTMPCLGGLTGPAASFALLRGDCALPGNDTYWVGIQNSSILVFQFTSNGVSPASVYFARTSFQGQGETLLIERGAWTMDTPEPLSSALMLSGLLAVWITYRRAYIPSRFGSRLE